MEAERHAGKRLWADCVKLGIEARKAVLKLINSFINFAPLIKHYFYHYTDIFLNIL